MCKFCEKDNVLMEKEVTNLMGIGPIGEGGYLDTDVLRVKFDDRGYLRLVNEDDGCLDHGQRIKVNFCFNCGRKID